MAGVSSDGRVKQRLVSPAADVREPANDICRVVPVHLDEIAVVDHPAQHLVHVVGLVRAVRDDVEQRLVPPIMRVGARARRR